MYLIILASFCFPFIAAWAKFEIGGYDFESAKILEVAPLIIQHMLSL
jgi:hypothetical protein